MNNVPMTYEPKAGEDINHACVAAVLLARENGCKVTFKFNDCEMVAKPESDSLTLAESYIAARNAAAEAYWASPAGIAEKARIEAADQRRREEERKPLAAFDCVDPDGWAAFVAANTDGYGSGVVRYAARWAALMEERMCATVAPLEACVESTSHEADTEGITGFMYGCAVGVLAKVWRHGEALRRWHNLST